MHQSVISCSIIICIWNQQDDDSIASNLEEEDQTIAYTLSEQNSQNACDALHQVELEVFLYHN